MTRLRAEVAVVTAIALCFQAIVPWLSPSGGRAVSDALLFVMVGRGAIRYGLRWRTERGRSRAAVVLGALSAGIWAVANGTYLIHQVFYIPTAFTIAGLMSVAAALLLPVGMHLNAPAVPGAERYRGFLDVAAVSGAVFALTWIYVLQPAKTSTNTLMTSGYAALLTGPEVVAAAVALVTMSRNLPKAAGHAPRLLGSASLILAMTALTALRNGVDDRDWYTGGCGAGYLLAGGLIMIASRAQTSRWDPAGADRQFVGAWAFLPYIPIILAVLATAAEQLRNEVLGAELVWVLLTTFGLVLLRQFLTVSIVGRLAVKLERQQATLAHQAHHDSLTGLHNRAAFHDLGVEMLAAQDGAAVLLLDLDGFKPVNDRLGHAAGDAVLMTVADRLNASVRPGDLVARLGGDEFALILGAPATEESGLHTANRILAALSEPMEIENEQVFVGGSIGLATGREELNELLRQADVAMYAAKASGKGACRAYRAEATPPRPSQAHASRLPNAAHYRVERR